MNLFILFLFIPLTFADAKFCAEISPILSDYEKDLNKAKVQKCADVKVADLLKGHEGLSGETFLEQRKCYSLNAIESELEKLKSQLSVATGIAKLKDTVAVSKQKAGEGEKPAGLNFVNSLNTAQSLEILLETQSFDNKPFLQLIKNFPDKKASFPAIMKELCKDKSDKDEDACNPKLFQPTPESIVEISKLMETTDVNAAQAEKWKAMLAIQKASGDKWSFTQMQNELKGAFAAIDNNQSMSRDHLNAIKRLENFKHAENFEFIKNIASVNDKKKSKIITDKFLVLLGDARLRQEYEAQSKLSIVWASNKSLFSGLPPEQIESCNKAKFLYNETKNCRKALADFAAKNIEDHELKNVLLPSIEASTNYADKLQASESSCKAGVEKGGSVPEACYAEINKDRVELQQQIRQLNILKDKIGSENQEKMVYRNFALYKYAQKCNPLPTSMDQCELEGEYALSKNALLAVKESLDVAVVFTPEPKAEEKMQELCDNEEMKKRKNFNEKLCKLLEKTPVVIQTNNVKPEDPKLTAPDGKHEEAVLRDQYIQAGTTLLKDVLGAYYATQFQPPLGVNPYPYNYAPYNSGIPPMGIADSIMFNARYNGAYGFYMPTAGYQPHTAFGVNSSISAYRPAASMPSRYFGR